MRMVRGIGWAAVWTVAGSILCMNAAVFSRWNGPGAATPSARSTASVNASPIRRSDPVGRRSFGAYTSIIGISGSVLSGTLEKHAAMCQEQLWKLKDDSMPGIRVDDQLRARNVLRESLRVDGRDHHVMMSIHDEGRLRNVLEF